MKLGSTEDTLFGRAYLVKLEVDEEKGKVSGRAYLVLEEEVCDYEGEEYGLLASLVCKGGREETDSEVESYLPKVEDCSAAMGVKDAPLFVF